MTRNDRFTKLQIELLIPALRQVYINHLNATRNGSMRDAHPDVCISGPTSRFGTNNPELLKKLLTLWDRVNLLRRSGGRIYDLEVFDFAALIFLVKTTLKQIRHGHHECWSPRLHTAAQRFLRRLEAQRKALKRIMIAELGIETYRHKGSIWRKFICYLSYHYLYCRCSYRPTNNLYRTRRLVLDRFCDVTAAELKTRDREVPSNLRKIIRFHLKSVRRGRTPYVYGQLRNDLVFAASCFANYVIYDYNHSNKED